MKIFEKITQASTIRTSCVPIIRGGVSAEFVGHSDWLGANCPIKYRVQGN